MENFIDTSIAKLDKTLGYFYLIVKGHPLADKNGKFYLHRYIASLKEGRWLTKDEHVDHINRIKTDNRPENLQVLSSSCHSKKTAQDRGYVLKDTRLYFCKNCNTAYKPEYISSKFCNFSCYARNSRKFDMTKENLQLLVWEYPTTKVAEMFGVSDVAIAKRCKLLGIKKPPRGYWSKIKQQQ